MSSAEEQRLGEDLAQYGIPSTALRPFRAHVTPELIDYLDLLEPPNGSAIATSAKPDAVAEVQGQPLLFFINESNLAADSVQRDKHLANLSLGLACRGDDVFLARILPGELLVERASLLQRRPNWRAYKAGSGESLTFFSRLVHGFDADGTVGGPKRGSVFQEMLKLLTHVADTLAERFSRADVLSLLGRALFFRFLVDRAIVTPSDLPRVCPSAPTLEDSFANPTNAASTSDWLDSTFNGNFLPLSRNGGKGFFDYVNGRYRDAFVDLTAIVRRWEPSGNAYQSKFEWATFDFAHVPVGLLSQVYEAFCWKWEHKSAKLTSVHYTPRHLAGILVDEAFDSLENAQSARLLDCACGAGVFLGLGFRRLYQERWKAIGVRPNTKDIRSILEKQLTGFDISDSALRLAALTLYLTAIELDPTPIPPEKLKFKDLDGSVLFNHRRRNGVDPEDGPVLGSLGTHITTRFDGQFDLVLSNPPWTSLSAKFRGSLTAICRDVFNRAGDVQAAMHYENPDITPDLPFLLRSTEWCKVGGRIAMALPARILLKQENTPKAARDYVFKRLSVSGIINGSNLSDADIWPGMSQPFMLLFATNERPKENHVVRLITPQYDKAVGDRGQLIIDSKSAQPLSLTDSFDQPWLWKALAVGTSLDSEVMRRLMHAGGLPLRRYWTKRLHLRCGKGFKEAAEQDQKPASFMSNYRELVDTTRFKFAVNASQLNYSERRQAHRPRKEGIYKGPLILIKESPGADRKDGRALLSLGDVLYTFSYTGYSASAHPNGEVLARYVHLLVHSSAWMHFLLMTSSKLAAERRRTDTADIEAFPIVPLENISHSLRSQIVPLSKRLLNEDQAVFEAIDKFVGEIYGLDDLDNEVIRDTLDVALPYGSSRERAWGQPTAKERDTFRRRLTTVLKPFFATIGKTPRVVSCKLPPAGTNHSMPYGSLLILDANGREPLVNGEFQSLILELGRETGSSRIIQVINGALCISILDQYRYWTPTRARLIAAEIVRRHLGIFEG